MARVDWVSHPLRRESRRGILAAGIIGSAVAGTAAVTGSVYWAGFSGAVLFLSLESFFLPTRYSVGEDGVSVQRVFSRSRVGWETFRRVYEDRRGLTLSPYRRRTALEPYRASRLLFDGGSPETIRQAVRTHLQPGAEWVGPGGEIEEIDGADGTRQPASPGRASG